MAEYDMPVEEQIKVLVKEFRSFKESVETRFDSIDTKLTTVDTKVTTLDTKVTTLDAKVTTLDAKVASLDTSVTTLDTKVTTLDSKIDKVQLLLEDTNAIAKLGLEGLQGLRESTDAKFAAAAKTNGEQTDLLKSVLVHVRKRVEHLERPKRRRRP
jgi:chromosome segregation ATPase